MFLPLVIAQAASPAPGAGDFVTMIVPMFAIMAVFYFLLFRPQQKKLKDHQLLVSKVAKGDTVVTSGGLIGRVAKVSDDNELLVEVGENVKVRVLRQAITDVRSKGEPVKSDSK